MRRMTLALLLLATLSACGSDGGAAPPADTQADDRTDVVNVPPDVSPDVATDSALCDDIWTRLQDCGLLYTFPNFESDCAEWQAAKDTTRIEGLQSCSIYACNRLRVCVEELSPHPG